jgi:hypothetical protein
MQIQALNQIVKPGLREQVLALAQAEWINQRCPPRQSQVAASGPLATGGR